MINTMKHFKHLLFFSILCSPVLFTNCGEDDAAAIEAASKATLIVTASPSDGGTISPQGGTYDVGTTVEVTATANADYSFTGWTGDFEGLSNPVPLIMLKDQSITANFELINSEGNSTNDGTNDGELIYLDANGVTIKASDNAVIGEEYSLNDKSYLVVDKTMLRELIVENKDVSKVVTTFITNMDDLFGGGEDWSEYPDDSLEVYETNMDIAVERLYDAPLTFDYNIASWDVSNVISMVQTFSGLLNYSDNFDFTYWDVSNVTNMKGLFKHSCFGGNFSGWDTSNVEDMSEILMKTCVIRAEIITDGGISSWNTGNVKNMKRAMFGNYGYLDWDLSAVEDMSQMFMFSPGGSTLEYLKDWDVSNVKNMSDMFSMTQTFNSRIEDWDVSNVTDMSRMFEWAGGFSRDIGNWDVSNVTDMEGMFSGTPMFNRDISSWDVSNVINMYGMFSDIKNFNQDLSAWEVSNVTDCQGFSYNATDWTKPKPNFTNCDYLSNPGSIYFDENGVTIKATDDAVIGENYELDGINYLVVDYSTLKKMVSDDEDVTKVVTSKVTGMAGLIGGGYSSTFNQDIGSWDVSNVYSMSFIFRWTSNFNQDISKWDISNVAEMREMFFGAISFNQDLSSWDVSNVTDCVNFSLDATSWTEPKPNFTNCTE